MKTKFYCVLALFCAALTLANLSCVNEVVGTDSESSPVVDPEAIWEYRGESQVVQKVIAELKSNSANKVQMEDRLLNNDVLWEEAVFLLVENKKQILVPVLSYSKSNIIAVLSMVRNKAGKTQWGVTFRWDLAKKNVQLPFWEASRWQGYFEALDAELLGIDNGSPGIMDRPIENLKTSGKSALQAKSADWERHCTTYRNEYCYKQALCGPGFENCDYDNAETVYCTVTYEEECYDVYVGGGGSDDGSSGGSSGGGSTSEPDPCTTIVWVKDMDNDGYYLNGSERQECPDWMPEMGFVQKNGTIGEDCDDNDATKTTDCITPCETALLSRDVYNTQNGSQELGTDPIPQELSGGWELNTTLDLSELTLTDDDIGFNSAVYQKFNPASNTYTYMYVTEGSSLTSVQDWVNNAYQVTGDSEQYEISVTNAEILHNLVGNSQLYFTGHSLGGGLASVNALATGRSAYTYNAAGLSDATRNLYDIGLTPLISATIVRGEIVDEIQQTFGMQAEGIIAYIEEESGFWQDFFNERSPALNTYKSIRLHMINTVIDILECE